MSRRDDASDSPILARLASALAERYRVEREVGSGGMATVYLAHDLKHDREVALKVLHPELGAVIGADRFLQEIKTTARLQHPHILGLIDSGEADGLLYYVMPFVTGESLRARLSREQQLPISDALRIASEVASALDYAHRQGVVHRDIKPENVLLHDGQALVADFGIALAVTAAGGGRNTQTGISLGTPHYMSPEQALSERTITARSDVYALGAMTYEMLTGDPPFTGSTAQAILSKVMTEKPAALSTTRDTVPPHVEDAVLTALAKLPADRWASAKEFADALADGGRARAYATGARPETHALAARPPYALVSGLFAALVLAAWGWLARPAPAAPPVTRVRVALPQDHGLQPQSFLQRFALAPDGSRVVYMSLEPDGSTQLWVRDRDALDGRPLAGTTGAMAPFFSPDGERVGFISLDLRVRTIPVAGGDVTALADSVNQIIPGGLWLPDGSILFTDSSWRLRRVPPGGGAATPVPFADSIALVMPHALPRDDAVLVTGCSPACNDMSVGALHLGTGAFKSIATDAVAAWYVPTGHVVVVRQDGAVVAYPFDVEALEVQGDAVPLFDGVYVAASIVPSFALAADGTLLYAVSGGAFYPPGVLVRVQRDGRYGPLDPDWQPDEVATSSLSPDGRQLAVAVLTGRSSDIWIKQLDRGPFTPLTTSDAFEAGPSWRPGGAEVAYVAQEGGWHIESRRPDGTGEVETIALPDYTTFGVPEWSPDGRWAIFGTLEAGLDVRAIELGGDSALAVSASPSADESGPALSPDGRWIAYASTESGRSEVYVRPFPDVAQGRVQVSTRGGRAPEWSLEGGELFFLTPEDEVTAVRVTTEPRFSAGEPTTLFSAAGFYLNASENLYLPERGGRSFIMLRPEERTEEAQLVMVLNWFEEVRRKLAR